MCGDYKQAELTITLYRDTTPRVRGLLYAHFFRLRNWRYNPACAGTTIIANFDAIVLLIQPRVCGDYNALRFVLFLAVDTTPRVRGLRRQKRAQWPCGRYNPACAGTTQIRWSWMPTHQIQPRVCGDYSSRVVVLAPHLDTTPRVRGLRTDTVRFNVDNRYNPACAGTTTYSEGPVGFPEIQPRVCGDYTPDEWKFCTHSDTTPRVRGLLILNVRLFCLARYNPACAGTTPHTCHHRR